MIWTKLEGKDRIAKIVPIDDKLSIADKTYDLGDNKSRYRRWVLQSLVNYMSAKGGSLPAQSSTWKALHGIPEHNRDSILATKPSMVLRRET